MIIYSQWLYGAMLLLLDLLQVRPLSHQIQLIVMHQHKLTLHQTHLAYRLLVPLVLHYLCLLNLILLLLPALVRLQIFNKVHHQQ
jgi:hypothetical protein